MQEINKGTRLVNYLIDMIVVGFIAAILLLVLEKFMDATLIFILVWMAYYFSCEFFTGRTLGKLITKTGVVDLKNEKPTAIRILMRTVLRLNPFDGISYLFGGVQGTHDVLSKTKLVVYKMEESPY